MAVVVVVVVDDVMGYRLIGLNVCRAAPAASELVATFGDLKTGSTSSEEKSVCEPELSNLRKPAITPAVLPSVKPPLGLLEPLLMLASGDAPADGKASLREDADRGAVASSRRLVLMPPEVEVTILPGSAGGAAVAYRWFGDGYTAGAKFTEVWAIASENAGDSVRLYVRWFGDSSACSRLPGAKVLKDVGANCWACCSVGVTAAS